MAVTEREFDYIVVGAGSAGCVLMIAEKTADMTRGRRALDPVPVGVQPDAPVREVLNLRVA